MDEEIKALLKETSERLTLDVVCDNDVSGMLECFFCSGSGRILVEHEKECLLVRLDKNRTAILDALTML